LLYFLKFIDPNLSFMKTFTYLHLSLIFLCAFVLSSCGNKPGKEELGVISFEVKGAKEALPYFEKGMLLLHSFEYQDAAENFNKARTIDPDFSMAYWGEAMTYNHSLWRFQDYEKADSILTSLDATPEGRVGKADSEMEKEFIQGVNILYGKGDKLERDKTYAKYMEGLYKKYPGNDEVAAFYSIALIGSVPMGRDVKVYEKAAEVAKEILARNPRHPGALHYLIHAYDDPDHAAKALNTADEYAQVAPSAAHALHMPTHIYLALGMWDKVISSNIASFAASEKRIARKKLGVTNHNYHSFHWLMYGYLQVENKEEAKNMVAKMEEYCKAFPSDQAREHLILLKSTYLVDSEDWDKKIVDLSVKETDLNIVFRAMNYFVKGLYAYRNDNLKDLETSIDKLNLEKMIDKEKISSKSVKMCGSVNTSIPNALDLQQSEVMELQLKALLALLQSRQDDAENLMKKASDLEKSISYAYGPPTIVKPSFEMYGEWLMEQGRPEEALKQFELSLKATPNRLLSVKGKSAAVELLSKKEVSRL